MSLQEAIDQWITAHHPKVLTGITKLVTKQNKQGKKVQSTVTEPDPAYQFILDHVGAGTIELLTTGRILFPLTRHESLCTYEQLNGHFQGKAYRRAAIKADNETIDWAQFEPYIIPHKRYPGMLYCALTARTLNKTRDDVEVHMAGMAFQRELAANTELLAQRDARREKVRARKQQQREFRERFNSEAKNPEDKYDFSQIDLDDMMDSFAENEGDEGDLFDFDGEGELDDEMFDFDEDDVEFEEDEDFEEEEEEEDLPPPVTKKNAKGANVATPVLQVMDLSKKNKNVVVEPVKGKKVAVVEAPIVTKGKKVAVVEAPIVTTKGKKAPVPVPTMVDSEEEDEDMFDDEDMEDEDMFDGEGEEGMSGMFDSEGEFIPGIYDGEGEFIPGMFDENGQFISFDMLAEGEFDDEDFEFDDEDDDEDIEIDVFDEDGNFDGDSDEFDDEDDEIDDDDDDEIDVANVNLLKNFAALKKSREIEAQKAAMSIPKGKKTPPAPSPQPTKSTKQAPPAPAPQPTKRKALEQIQPHKKQAPPQPQYTKQAPPQTQNTKQQQKNVQLPPPSKGKQAPPQQQAPQGKKGRK